MNNPNLSAVIIAKNEAHIILKCIAALSQVTNDIIVVLDDSTTDNTTAVCEHSVYSAIIKVVPKKWEGYSKSKNFGVSLSKNKWIVCVDADEVMDKTLIHNLQNQKLEENAIYEMNIQTYFGDYAVQHCGWFPDWNIRLFNKVTTSWNDNYVHEKLVYSVPLRHHRIDGLIQHFSFRSEEDMVKKFEYYARLRAQEWIRSDKKPAWYKSLIGPQFRFLRTYLLKLGILDGKVGFTIAKNEYILKRNELKYYKQLMK